MPCRLALLSVLLCSTACGAGGDALPSSSVSGEPSSAPELSRIYARSLAVVVGINGYTTLTRLQWAVRDAEAMALALRNHGFEVTTLLDGEATQTRLREVLGDRLRQEVGPEDRVVVYFAGHGVSVGDRGAEIGYLMPIEGQSYAPVSSGISMTEVVQWFQSYRSKHVMFIADACYSGLALGTRGAAFLPRENGYLAQIASQRVRFSLVAGTAEQQVHEADGHGVFTRFVLDGIAGSADANQDGLVTSDELASFVRPRVSSFVHEQYQAAQLPESSRIGSGELIFFVPKPAGLTAAAPRNEPPTPEPKAQAPEATTAVENVESEVVVAPVRTLSTPTLPPLSEPPPTDIYIDPIGTWQSTTGHAFHVQREGKKVVMAGAYPDGRFVLGMIHKRGAEARFEGAGRVLRGEQRGRFLQVVVRLIAVDANSARYDGVVQPLDASGVVTGPPQPLPPTVLRHSASLPSPHEPLDLLGRWTGAEERVIEIRQEGEDALLECKDRWGTFSGRTRFWGDQEAVFEGTGTMLAGPRTGSSYRIAARFVQSGDHAITFEPVIQYLDVQGNPGAASLLGYTLALARSAELP